MGEWRETRENKEAGGKQEGIQCKVADPSAFRHGHFNFHHTENFPNHFNRQRERAKEMDKTQKKVDEVKQKCGGAGSSRETGAQRCLRGQDRANKSPGIQTCAT